MYRKPAFLDDEYDHLSKGRANVKDDDYLPDYFNKESGEKQYQIKRNTVEINLPWLINGTPQFDIKTKFMGDQIFSRKKIHKNEILQHLFKIYRATLLAA